MTVCIPPSTVRYFFGRISRDDAERILKTRKAQQGLYLLRESMQTAGNYVLCLCHQGKIHHYSIERQPSGSVMIQDGRQFAGPVELVQHHQRNLDGFLCKPTVPCERASDQQPMAWPGVTMLELEMALVEKAQAMGFEGPQLENVLGPQRQKLVLTVSKELHEEQPWFHGTISREGADQILHADQHGDGTYLVRQRDDKSFALSLIYRRSTKHYKIDYKASSGMTEKLAIEDGPKFDSLMDMIGHYHNKTDGLLCKLAIPCVKRGYQKKIRNIGNLKALTDPSGIYNLKYTNQQPSVSNQRSSQNNGSPSHGAGANSRGATPSRLRSPNAIPSHHSNFSSTIGNLVWDEPDHDSEPPQVLPRRVPETGGDESQKIYDAVPRTEEVFNLNKSDLEICDKIGAGNFGAVVRGQYKRAGQSISVAIKTLKKEDVPSQEGELMKEARAMAGLQHRNIVRLIGVCKSETIMLVMELAPLGQLNKYLKKRPDFSMSKIIELISQVAEGMSYLESKNFVHRDLAARNVLLVTDWFAKISDFGMSKALGMGNSYYQAETAGKWPLKWYAPECIYYFKFDSKSDVWSYGVTLWEAMSYGARPYKGLKGQQILELIDSGQRLEKPSKCPSEYYQVMERCWAYKKEDRPNFKEICAMIKTIKQR